MRGADQTPYGYNAFTMTELYMGLAAIQAGLLALFVASTFVLAQMARASFSLVTPSFLLGQKRVRILLATSALVILVAVAGAFRTAFPGNLQTGIYTDSAWLAVGLTIALLVTGVFAAWSLERFVFFLQGPGLVHEMVRSVKPKRWSDWVKLGSPQDTDEYRRLQDQRIQGEITDPLAPLFEIAQVAVREGRYSLTDNVFQEVRWFLNDFSTRIEDTKQGVSSEECIRAVLPHFNDFVATASSLGAESQVGIGLANLSMLGMEEVSSGNGSSAVRLSYALSNWASRFVANGQDANAVSTIRNLRSIAETASQTGDLETLSYVALALGKVGEDMAAHLSDEPEKLIPAGFTEPEYDTPLSSLTEAMENMSSWFTSYESEIRGTNIEAAFILDSLYACCFAFLKCRPFGNQADEAAAAFARYMSYLGTAAAKTNRTDVAGMVLYRIEELYQLPNVKLGEAKRVMTSACIASSQMGVYAEAELMRVARDQEQDRSNHLDRLVNICARSGPDAIDEAKLIHPYKSSLELNTADQAEDAFWARVQATV